MKRILIIIIILFMCGCTKEEITINNVDVLKYNTDEYYGYLVIPKINMKKGFYNVNSRLNNVNKNVTLLKSNIKNTYILAAHSGTGKIAFFNDLKYLEKNDDIFLKFKDKIVHYQVSEIREEVKTGKIHLKDKENMIILTTCSQEHIGYQLIIEGEEISG